MQCKFTRSCTAPYSGADIPNGATLLSGTSHFTLYCTALHCTAKHCTALRCTALHCTALYNSLQIANCSVHCITMRCTVLHCTALHCTALHCSTLPCANEVFLYHYQVQIWPMNVADLGPGCPYNIHVYTCLYMPQS